LDTSRRFEPAKAALLVPTWAYFPSNASIHRCLGVRTRFLEDGFNSVLMALSIAPNSTAAQEQTANSGGKSAASIILGVERQVSREQAKSLGQLFNVDAGKSMLGRIRHARPCLRHSTGPKLIRVWFTGTFPRACDQTERGKRRIGLLPPPLLFVELAVHVCIEPFLIDIFTVPFDRFLDLLFPTGAGPASRGAKRGRTAFLRGIGSNRVQYIPWIKRGPATRAI
jgi:hypothetical protein